MYTVKINMTVIYNIRFNEIEITNRSINIYNCMHIIYNLNFIIKDWMIV